MRCCSKVLCFDFFWFVDTVVLEDGEIGDVDYMEGERCPISDEGSEAPRKTLEMPGMTWDRGA